MKTPVAFAALLVALNAPGAAFAQASAPASPSQTPRPGSGLTRDLNSLPPAAVAPAPATPAATPQTSAPATAATARTATPAPTPAPAPRTTAPAAATPAAGPATPAAKPDSAPTPRATTPGAAPSTSGPNTPAPNPATSPAATAIPAGEPAPEPPVMTVLNPAAIAVLPFTVELPAGFRVTTGRPGPDFRIYTIRRGEQSFVTVYAGPASQFPIYTGETVQAGGRASIVVADQTGQRHALEHLFQRPAAPREIHVWTSSLDGADQLLAERIAQSIDDR